MNNFNSDILEESGVDCGGAVVVVGAAGDVGVGAGGVGIVGVGVGGGGRAHQISGVSDKVA